MTRRLLNLATVLSLLLCVAVASLWVRTDVAGGHPARAGSMAAAAGKNGP